jgi:hypothetical protein
MSISVNDFVGGLDATNELERQILLVLNNLFHILSSGPHQGELWKGCTYVRLDLPNGDHWEVQQDRSKNEIKTVSFWYQFAKEKHGPNLRYLRWTRKTNSIELYLGSRQEILLICHSALQGLIDCMHKRVSQLERLMLPYARLHAYAKQLKVPS